MNDPSKLTSLEAKVGQLFFVGLPGPELDDVSQKLLREINPGGVCLFARNIKQPEQTRLLIDDIRKALPIVPFVSVDQEGGLVDRLRRIIGPSPAASKFVDIGDVRAFGRMTAEIIGILGFNMDFAPVVDVIDDKRSQFSNGLFSRAYGASADEATKLAGGFAEALTAGGIIPCFKHFPGLGGADVDSHDQLPQVNASMEEMEATDLVPYRRFLPLFEQAAVMVAHASYPKIDLQETGQDGTLLPSSLSSSIVTGLLRTQLGFDGVVITDDLEMGAILENYGIGEACKMAIKAGEDMLAICAGIDSIYDGFNAVLEAVRSGEISEHRLDRSLDRIAHAKKRLGSPPPFNAPRLGELSTEIAELISRLN